jgi:hypothetical protein
LRTAYFFGKLCAGKKPAAEKTKFNGAEGNAVRRTEGEIKQKWKL